MSSFTSSQQESKPRLSDSSGYEEDVDPSVVPPDTVLRTYGIVNTGSHVNFRIHDGGSQSPCVYYINNSMFTPGTPDVQLLEGDSRDGPMVAFAKFHNLSAHVTIGLGDPASNSVVCEELHKVSKIAHSEYVFETSENRSGKRRKYIWRRTVGKNLHANYACLDGATGNVVAYFLNSGLKELEEGGQVAGHVQRGCAVRTAASDHVDGDPGEGE